VHLRQAGERVDDRDKSASLDVGATPRRSTSSLGTLRMTIAEFVLRRGKRSVTILYAWLGLMVAIFIFLPGARQSIEVIALPGIAACLWYRSKTRCPICGRNIANDVEKSAMPFTEPIDACPYCNASFNQPMPIDAPGMSK
jgi:hypothetical protein